MNKPITATAVERMRRWARQHARDTSVPYGRALDQAARDAGFASWHDVRRTAKPTAAAGAFAACPLSTAPNAGLCGNSASSGGASSAATAAPSASTTMMATSVRRAMRPEAAASLAVFTPTTTSASTSGTTVICKALSQR